MSQELVDKILTYISEYNKIDTLELANIFNEDHQKIVGCIKSIQSTGELLNVENKCYKYWELTEEGQSVIQNGSHEVCVYKAIPEEGIEQSELMKIVTHAKIGFSKAMSAGWIKVDKTGPTPLVKKNVGFVKDLVRLHLKNICSGYYAEIPDKLKQEYKKRKLIQEVVIKSFNLSKGPDFSTSLRKLEADLTTEMLASGSWKTLKFKDYNMDALGAPPECGYLHPLLQVRSEFRQIFLEMGFSEMATNNYVESSFWNFDALYQPQQHPARDCHDTFFISDPKVCTNFPMDYLERVKTVHSVGAYGSKGYGYDWKLEEAQKNLLRTHTTANSARILYQLVQEKGFQPIKCFSIDRVYRNETLDATHLAEFHQVEGVVGDRGLTLGDLIGVISTFFSKLGITELDFKPAYNPYTEPSMEIFCFHKGLGRWIEIGNSGMFRPELLLPIGVPEDVNVLGFGLSLERPTMIKYGYNNIRDLVGSKVDLQMARSTPLCRLDK